MNLYVIERKECYYDEFESLVIIASSEEEAREYGVESTEEYYRNEWLDPEKSICIQYGVMFSYTKKGIIHSFFYGRINYESLL